MSFAIFMLVLAYVGSAAQLGFAIATALIDLNDWVRRRLASRRARPAEVLSFDAKSAGRLRELRQVA